MTLASPLKLQDREKWSCQILKEASWAHRDGRPAVRRTFLAGLETCLFTKVDVLAPRGREMRILRKEEENATVYATFIGSVKRLGRGSAL